MSKLEFLYLKQEDVIAAGVLDMSRALEDVENVFRMLVEGRVVMPKKTVLDFYGEGGVYNGHIVAMPVYAKEPLNVALIKWAAGFIFNPAKYNLPHGIDVIILSDIESGRPLAIMDGTLVTAIRTGAVNGIAAKYLAAPDSKTAGIVGAGVIGRTTVWALLRVLPELEEVRVFDLRGEKARRLAEETGDGRLRAVASLREAVVGSDVVVTATTSQEPIIKGDWLKAGCLCIQMGKREYEPAAILAMDRWVVDNWEQFKGYERALIYQLCRDGAIREEDIEELPDIVAGRRSGRVDNGEKIFFDSFGMACEDLAVAYRVYREALGKGIGTKIALWENPIWT